jgi:predicted SAM-dependent methyltransferase
MKFEDIKYKDDINLYLGTLPEDEKRKSINKNINFIGISDKLENYIHIKHDISKENLDLSENSVKIIQAEDVLEHIDIENIENIINEIYRLLKPDGLFRLSLPDYNFDIYNTRTIKNDKGDIMFDPDGGGRFNKQTNKVEKGGHLWFPTYEIVRKILDKTHFEKSKINFLHYYCNSKSITNNIDYSMGFISRTPDYDIRAQSPYRAMSIVVDCYK